MEVEVDEQGSEDTHFPDGAHTSNHPEARFERNRLGPRTCERCRSELTDDISYYICVSCLRGICDGCAEGCYHCLRHFCHGFCLCRCRDGLIWVDVEVSTGPVLRPGRMRPVLRNAKPGQLLWNYTDAESLELLQDPLERCQHKEQASHLSLRGTRACKATQMAKVGEDCLKMQRNGQVKGSQSMMRYMANEAIGKPKALRVQLDLSDAEDEAGGFDSFKEDSINYGDDGAGGNDGD